MPVDHGHNVVRPRPTEGMASTAISGLLRQDRKVAELPGRLGALRIVGLAGSAEANVAARPLCRSRKQLGRWRARDKMRRGGTSGIPLGHALFAGRHSGPQLWPAKAEERYRDVIGDPRWNQLVEQRLLAAWRTFAANERRRWAGAEPLFRGVRTRRDFVRVGACPGADGVFAAMLRAMRPAATHIVFLALSRRLRGRDRLPAEAWRRSSAVCLPKPGTDQNLLKGWCVITMVSSGIQAV